ncbi:MAG: hypothetical protein SFU56_07620 [Capsulimonadales bacterium]|nr:hypothetical protein [Capsulimonadales bacterium]
MSEQWYWLVPKDQRHNNFVFWHEGPPRTVRNSYLHLRCPQCGKIDETNAVFLPTEPDVKIRSRSDIVGTDDGMLCFSQRAKSVTEQNGIGGLRFLPVGLNHQYFMVWPTNWVPVDLSSAGFQYEEGDRFCSGCGRPRRGAYVGPLRQSFPVPDDAALIVAPSAWREGYYTRNLWLLVSENTKAVFKREKLSGIEFSVPL